MVSGQEFETHHNFMTLCFVFRSLSFPSRATPSNTWAKTSFPRNSCRPRHPGNSSEKLWGHLATTLATGCCPQARRASAVVSVTRRETEEERPCPDPGSAHRTGGLGRSFPNPVLSAPTRPGPARPAPHRAPADERVRVRVAHEGPQLGQEGRDVAGPRRARAHGHASVRSTPFLSFIEPIFA